MVEVLNKADLLDGQSRAALAAAAVRNKRQIPVSAVTGEGVAELLALIENSLAAGRAEMTADIPVADGAALAYLYRIGEVLDRIDGDQVCHVRVRLDQADIQKFKNSFPQVVYALS